MSTRLRAIATVGLGYFYTIGQFILPGLAYLIPHWRWLQLTVSTPFFAFFLLSWYVALAPHAPPQGHQTGKPVPDQANPVRDFPGPGQGGAAGGGITCTKA